MTLTTWWKQKTWNNTLKWQRNNVDIKTYEHKNIINKMNSLKSILIMMIINHN